MSCPGSFFPLLFSHLTQLLEASLLVFYADERWMDMSVNRCRRVFIHLERNGKSVLAAKVL